VNRPTAAALLLLAAACAPKAEPPSPPAAEPPVVTFVATDFAFEGPDTIAPGFTTIRMENRGPQEHHLILARLDEGKTIDSLMAFFQATPNAEPPFVTWRGAANSVLAGGTSGGTVDLPAGQYVLLCFIPDPADGAPHLVKGMVRGLVVAGEPNGAAAPVANAELRLKDLAFTHPPFTAGTHVIHVINDGPQVHEAQLVRLAEGKTAQDFLASEAPGYKGERRAGRWAAQAPSGPGSTGTGPSRSSRGTTCWSASSRGRTAPRTCSRG
jgi:hypothetical protein